jgi:hypothetical protein
VTAPQVGQETRLGVIAEFHAIGPDAAWITMAEGWKGLWVSSRAFYLIPQLYHDGAETGQWYVHGDWEIPFCFLDLHRFAADDDQGARDRYAARYRLSQRHPEAYRTILGREPKARKTLGPAQLFLPFGAPS